MRLLYIKFTTFMMSHEQLIIMSLTLLSAGMTTILTIMFEGPKTAENLVDICHGFSREFAVVRFHYQNPGQVVNYQERFVVTIGFVLVIAEMACYFIIFKSLSEHDKSMSNFLPHDKVRKRIRKNVIDLTGHVVHFGVEIGCLFVFALIGPFISQNGLFTRSFIMSNYALTAIAYFGFSQVLQNEVVILLKRIAFFVFHVFNKVTE